MSRQPSIRRQRIGYSLIKDPARQQAVNPSVTDAPAKGAVADWKGTRSNAYHSTSKVLLVLFADPVRTNDGILVTLAADLGVTQGHHGEVSARSPIRFSEHSPEREDIGTSVIWEGSVKAASNGKFAAVNPRLSDT